MRKVPVFVALLAFAVGAGGCVNPFGCPCRDPSLPTSPSMQGGRESANLDPGRAREYHGAFADRHGHPAPGPNKEDRS